MKLFSKISKNAVLCLGLLPISLLATASEINLENSRRLLAKDLALIKQVDEQATFELPLILNYSLLGGYFCMPSARMAKMGTVSLGASAAPPVYNYGINIQPFSWLEISLGYRSWNQADISPNTDRIGQVKALLIKNSGMGFSGISGDFSLAIGTNDFFVSPRHGNVYLVGTKQCIPWNLELSAGYGWHGGLHGLFGAAAWTPWAHSKTVLRGLSLLVEYEANNANDQNSYDPFNGIQSQNINWGAVWSINEAIQLSCSSIQGTHVAGAINARIPLGSTAGFLQKTKNPTLYEYKNATLGIQSSSEALSKSLDTAFSGQGFRVAQLEISREGQKKCLWIRLINTCYRLEPEIKERIQYVLAALAPSNISEIVVDMEAGGVPSSSYLFRGIVLDKWRHQEISRLEMNLLSPMNNPAPPFSRKELCLETHNRKPLIIFACYPIIKNYFCSSSGKIKYSAGIAFSPQGYLADLLYYKLTLRYLGVANFSNIGSPKEQNPSYLPNVRTDSLEYAQPNTVSLEQAYIQKSFYCRGGWYARFSGGYFEAAYGGVTAELLYYPVNSAMAIGIEGALLAKRSYSGWFEFTNTVKKYEGDSLQEIIFYPSQYFINLYYMINQLQVELVATAGQFLAKDVGVSLQAAHYFRNGVRFGAWYTWTNGKDHVNNQLYHDKGVSISMPLDFFLPKSSRRYLNYAMSNWLRDVGAQVRPGNSLYYTLKESR